MTVQLRAKLDTLTETSEKKYDLVHVPMDSDMYRSGLSDSPYFEIIKRQSANINYVMSQVSTCVFVYATLVLSLTRNLTSHTIVIYESSFTMAISM